MDWLLACRIVVLLPLRRSPAIRSDPRCRAPVRAQPLDADRLATSGSIPASYFDAVPTMLLAAFSSRVSAQLRLDALVIEPGGDSVMVPSALAPTGQRQGALSRCQGGWRGRPVPPLVVPGGGS